MKKLIANVFSLSILGLGIFSTSALANDFVMIEGDKSKYLLDRDSIVRTGTTAKATFISIYSSPISTGGTGYASTREFSCTTRRVRDIKSSYFFENGAARQDFKVEEWRNIPSNTIIETFLDIVCNRP